MTSGQLPDLDADFARETAARFFDVALAYIERARSGDGSVSTALTPAQLAERFQEALPVAGMSVDALVARIERDVVSDANRLMHPMAMGHQVSPPLPIAIWMEPLIAAMNQSVAVSEMSPTGTAVETRVMRWMCELVGWGAHSGGTFTSGGTEATFTALLAARAAACPDAWQEGVGADPPVVLCGEHAHYAITRAVAQLGLGMKRAVVIPSNGYRMDPVALVRTLDMLARSGTRVMAVVATSGSTATGSFDDLEAIGAACEERGIWLHVDGAHGASALLSSMHRARLHGIERASSIAWDPHKMLLMPLQAGMLLVRDERRLEAAFAQRAPYLFHGAEGERVIDQGVRSFLCSRRADVLKLWAALERYGVSGLGAIYDALCETTRGMWESVRSRAAFEAVNEPECNILCFRWIGDGRRSDAELDAINLALRERWNRSGRGWITTTLLGGRRVLRVTVMNPGTTSEHTEQTLDGLQGMAAIMVDNEVVSGQSSVVSGRSTPQDA